MQAKRVFYSRDVLFNEVNQEHEKLTNASKPPEEKRYLSIEYVNDDEHDAESEVESLLRRSTRQRRPPDYYGDRATVANSNAKEPTTVAEALTSSEKVKWENAMTKEMELLHANDVWDLMELPKDHKARNKWIFKLKINADGLVECYKARLVFVRNWDSIMMKHFVL